MARSSGIYDFPATQVGGHSIGTKIPFAEFTANTGRFKWLAIDFDTFLRDPLRGAPSGLLRSAARIMRDPAT